MTKGLSLGGAVFCVAYLMNPTAGVFELPDYLPIIGNLDEATATVALLYFLSNLGINILPGTKKLLKKDSRED